MSSDHDKNAPQSTIIVGMVGLYGEPDDGGTVVLRETTGASEKPSFEPPRSGVDSSQHERLGRYIKLGLLGVGGMGEVFRVYDETLKRSIALKTLHARLMGNQRTVSRFLEEAQIVAQLQHPNIIPVHELGQLPDGRHYFTMQEIRGTEFTTQIRAVHGASTPARWGPGEDGSTFRGLIQTFHQVCVTMAYAHSRGVIHRDLKPDNIMIGGFGDVLVVDWGLAKLIGRIDEPEVEAIESDRSQDDGFSTRMGTIAGTPAYMSPEQANGQTDLIGQASDIYTLGAILYELLGGIPPFVGSSGQEIVEKVQASQPPSLLSDDGEGFIETTGLVPNNPMSRLPPALVQISERAMEREIADRYGSAEELAGAVRSWLDGVEKRDKALKEVDAAAQILQQAISEELGAAQRWSEANAMMEREGAPSEASWALWQKTKLAESESRRLRRLHLRKIEGALVHDPGLEEAHLELVQLQIGHLANATAVGDIRAREVHQLRFDNHIKFLSSSQADLVRKLCEERSVDTIAGLRARRGAMVGRDQLRQEVSSRIKGGGQFISLVGTAGVGKTRLALELAQDLRDDVVRAVFCDLTEATDALGVVRLLSTALGTRVSEDDPIGRLTEVLAEQSTLLVLDNLEQVAESVGSICQGWMVSLPDLKIIATSRVRLGIPAEAVVSLKPLSLLGSVELFARRGQAADSRFELDESNRDQVCVLVQKLDGLPLAIELAAARLNTLSLDEILERLAGRFQLLRTRGREAQALEGALDWSWDLLEPFEQAALAQVSIFRGGFNLAAAEAVVDVSSWKDRPAMFEIVAALSDNSLLREMPTEDGSVRYGMLESIRAYAWRKLSGPEAFNSINSGPEAVGAAKIRHAAHFARLGESNYLSELTGFGSAARWKELFLELDNLVVAIDCGAGDSAGRCCLAALKILGMKGPVSLGIDLATRVLRGPKLSHRLKIQIEIERSKCLRISGRMDEARAVVSDSTSLLEEPEEPDDSHSAITELNESTSVGKEMGPDGVPASAEKDELLEADRLMEMGNSEREQNCFDKAVPCFEQALSIFQSEGDRNGEGLALENLGSCAQIQGQFESAIQFYVAAIQIDRETGNSSREAIAMGNLASVYRNQGKTERAEELFFRALKLHREGGNRRFEGITLGNIGNLMRARDQNERAAEHYQEAITILREVGDARSEGCNHGNLGTVLTKLRRNDEAESCYRKAISICDPIFPVAAGAFRGNLGLMLAERGEFLGALELIEEAEVQVEADLQERAKLVAYKGRVQHMAGEVEAARASLKRVQAMAAELSVNENSDVAQEINRLERRLSENAPDAGSDTNKDREYSIIEGDKLIEAGNIEREQSQYGSALKIYLAALSLYDEHGHTSGAGVAHERIGSVCRIQGKHDEANQHFQQSLQVSRSIGNRQHEGVSLGALATSLLDQGRFQASIEHYELALAIHRDLGDKRGEGSTLGTMGIACAAQGHLELALEHFGAALAIQVAAGDKPAQGRVHGNMANALRGTGQLQLAIEHYELALDIWRAIGDCGNEGVTRGNLGVALHRLGQVDEARAMLEEAIQICDNSIPLAVGFCCGSLAQILAEQGDLAQAHRLLERGEPVLEGYRVELGKFLCRKGVVQCLGGQVEAAHTSLSQATAIGEELQINERSELARAIAELRAMI